MSEHSEKTTQRTIRNIAVTLSYVGTNYHGWQIQKNAISVQEVFQKALYKILNESVDIKGCSRTDTGVHANMYVVNFKTTSKIHFHNLICALNRHLPDDISAYECTEKTLDFHSRYSCKGKEYIYKVWNNKVKNPFLSGRALHYWYPLDIYQMKKSSECFIGTHDFTAFATIDKRAIKNMQRTVRKFEVEKEGDNVNFIVEADGFLYNMVRIMVGTLLRVLSLIHISEPTRPY